MSKCKRCSSDITWVSQQDAKGGTSWIPRDPLNYKDHRNSCAGANTFRAATIRAAVEKSNAKRFGHADPASPKLTQVARIADAPSAECKFCQSAIKWIDKTPFNTDGTRHSARCTGRPAGQVGSVIDAMVREARTNSTRHLSI